MNTNIWNSGRAILFSVAVLATVSTVSCAQKETPVYTVGAGSSAGMYADAGRALAIIVNANQAANGFRLEDEMSSGSVANIDAILAGEIQFGIAQADDQYHALMGIDKWRDKGPQDDLRAMFSLYVESVTLVAGGDTDIRTIDDLKGKVVDIGLPGSGTHENAVDALNAAGIDWRNDVTTIESSLDDRLNKFMKGGMDAFFFTVGHPNKETNFATFSQRGARLVDLSNISGLVNESPFYTTNFIAKELYPRAENSKTTLTVGVRATLLTSAKVSDDVVYAATKSVFERADKYAEIFPELSSLTDGKFLEGLTAPIHPGALRYFEEAGIAVPAP